MNKNKFAVNPPMGWNSYDYYDTTVNEEQIKANADYMAKHLRPYGWEYVIVDIEWYSYGAGSRREEYQYIPFGKVEIDEYSRLQPCIERFPSSANGKGFAPLAEYVHSLGLKFGIHIMRGIPRIAAHMGSSILGTEKTAADIANAYSICPWNPDMYGVDVSKPEAQLYYDSLIKLYADWGVDFIKCDDICNYESQSAQLEIQMIYNAIQKYGRPIVLSLSPGPARIEKAWIYEKYANMWRITDDLWDKWEDILQMFDRCELWQNHVSEGCYPDCDMIPFGMIGKGFNDERKTHLTYNEQITLMTLWCIFRSPLMIGADLPQLDEETLKLFTNRHVLKLHRDGRDARQVRKNINEIIWVAKSKCKDVLYVAVFNLQDNDAEVSVTQDEMNQYMNRDVRLLNANITELWQDKTYPRLADSIPGHGSRLYQVEIIR